jgi:hypothetical protein
MDYWNTQEQRRFVWPPSFALARAYVDQLERSNGLAAARLQEARGALAGAEAASGAERRTMLTQLATQLTAEASRSTDQAKVRLLATAITGLATAGR